MSKRRTETTLKPRMLQKRKHKLKLIDVVTLLHNMYEGARNDKVGFEDANRTMESIKMLLTRKRIYVDKSLVESVLWSCNLLNEQQLFWDVKERGFDDFLRSVLGSEKKFDKFYNIIKGPAE